MDLIRVDVLQRLMRDRTGATAVEYALLVALVCLLVLSTVRVIGEDIRDIIDEAVEGLRTGE